MQTKTFTNNAIEVETLPSVSELSSSPLDKQYRINNRLISAGATILLTAITAVLVYQPSVLSELAYSEHATYIVITVFFLGGCHLLYRTLADPLKSYALREKDISYTSGLIYRKTVTQPLRRIQHVEVQQGPIDRYTGLAKLQVFSAGGVSYTFAIPGLKREKAMQLRQHILQHKENKDVEVQDIVENQDLTDNA
jgi:membrane protein YdbS with pleckstrin-like domain